MLRAPDPAYGALRARSALVPVTVQPAAQGRPWRGQSPQQRHDARRRRLLDAALEQFGTIGYAASSVTLLCATAGVSTRHFYELYPGREQLMADLYDEIVLETARVVREAQDGAVLTAHARVTSGLRAAIAHQTDDPRRARVLQLEAIGVSSWLEQHRRGVIASFAVALEEQYRLLVADGQMRDEPFRAVATALIGAFDELLVHWLLTEPRTPPQDLLPVAAEVFLGTFAGRATTRKGSLPR